LLFELRVLFQPLLELYFPLRNVESVTSEQTVYLFLELHQIRGVKSVAQALGREKHQSFVETLVLSLVGHNLRLKLHITPALLVRLFVNGLVFVNDSGISLRHLDRLFIELFLLRGQNLWLCEVALLGFLLQHLLFVFKAKQLSTVVQQGL
jgi:hypothetical protein